jgi:ankyrin repeat protein
MYLDYLSPEEVRGQINSINVNSRDSYGATPLMVFISKYHLYDYDTEEETEIFEEILEIFLNAGADVDATDDDGETVAHYACYYDLAVYIEYNLMMRLITHKNANLANNNGQTPVDIGLEGYHDDGPEIVISHYTLTLIIDYLPISEMATLANQLWKSEETSN